jgi:hypothetical protein
MRVVMGVAAALLSIASGSASASGQALRGDALLRMCQGSSNNICAAYFVGFVSGAMMSDAERAVGNPLCLSGVSAQALRRAFLGFAKDHPHLTNRQADGLVATAAARSFPCHRPSAGSRHS